MQTNPSNPSETAPAEGQTSPSGEQKETTIKYEIGLTWTGARYNVLRVKAKLIEGENRWNAAEVLDAVATLLWKYGVEIDKDAIRGNRLVASWIPSLLDAHSCSGTLTVVLTPYKEGTLSLRDELYTQKIDVNGENWMVKSANVNISCTTNKYSHEISLSFDHNRIVDRYDDKEMEYGDKCNSLPTQVKINKVHEILLTIVQALPLIEWYTGKYTIEEME